MEHIDSITVLELRCRSSLMQSQGRRFWAREYRRRRRRLLALTFPVLLVGVAGMVYYVTLPMPLEEWYIGLGAVALALPFLTVLTR